MEQHTTPNDRLKATGRELFESVATVRIDDTQAPNGRVAIHVEHPNHDRGVRCFFRSIDSDAVEASIKSHLKTEIESDLSRVEVIDEVGIGISERSILPRRMSRDRPGSREVEADVTVKSDA